MSGTPVQWQIALEVAARLAIISTGSGYWHQIDTVDIGRADPFEAEEVPCALVSIGADTLIDERSSTERRELSIQIRAGVERGEISPALTASRLGTDVAIAINRSTTDPAVSDTPSHRLGGIVSGLRVESIAQDIGDAQAAYIGAIVELVVTYQVARGDPFTLIP